MTRIYLNISGLAAEELSRRALAERDSPSGIAEKLLEGALREKSKRKRGRPRKEKKSAD